MASWFRAVALAAAAGGLFWAAPASTDEAATSAAARIQENAEAAAAMMDSNRDGQVSKAEFLRHNANRNRFAELDADGNGELDAEEQKAVSVGPRSFR
jgi:EF hand